jgi:hypothetical protein
MMVKRHPPLLRWDPAEGISAMQASSVGVAVEEVEGGGDVMNMSAAVVQLQMHTGLSALTLNT